MEKVEDIYALPFPKQDAIPIAQFFDKMLHEPTINCSEEEIAAEKPVSSRSNTIHMDVIRTRSSLFSTELHQQTQKVLHHFCRLGKLQYKQGLNEILAPFMFFRQVGLSLAKCYALFRAFFDRYCLNFYYDKDFNSLEIIFRMVAVVIRYHDPALARYLQNYQVQPQIYCVGWLMTMFASKLSLKLTYTLWQFLIAQRDDHFLFFLLVAIILFRKQVIIRTRNSSIFTVVTDLIFRTEQELTHTIKIALLLRKYTPSSLLLFFRQHRVFRERKSFQRLSALLNQVQKVSVFLVGSGQISLRQHFKLGLCELNCYFCSLHQPLRLPYSKTELSNLFPGVCKMLSISNDLRQLQLNIDFIVVDIRNNKERRLPLIKGINIYPIDIDKSIDIIQGQFNEKFMEMRGKEHFLFLLNYFSFQKPEQTDDPSLIFCQKFIKILNSYSYPYLSILEGGQSAYFNFLRELMMKSELVNSKLVPVSELEEGRTSIFEQQERERIIGRYQHLQLSELIYLQRFYDNQQLRFFNGEDESAKVILMVLKGLVIWAETSDALDCLLKFIAQRKSIVNHLVEQFYVLEIPFRVLQMHSIFRIEKMTVRLHHNNCMVFYLIEGSEEDDKVYRKGNPHSLFVRSQEQIVREDLKTLQKPTQIRRVGFQAHSLQIVKDISLLVKQNYKQAVRLKKNMMDELQRKDELNYNIIQDFDFSRKSPKQLDDTDS